MISTLEELSREERVIDKATECTPWNMLGSGLPDAIALSAFAPEFSHSVLGRGRMCEFMTSSWLGTSESLYRRRSDRCG